jgi:hypothetical protein
MIGHSNKTANVNAPFKKGPRMTNVYVKPEEVRKACADLGISDWTVLDDGHVSVTDATVLRDAVGGDALKITLDRFKLALEIELEHGTRFPDTNVTSNHPILTGQIVLAHLKEGLDYYERLVCMELEMEIAAAQATGDTARAKTKTASLAIARKALPG